MKKINLYIFNLTSKYVLLNIFFITTIIIFINLLEISRLIDNNNSNFTTFILLSILKIPSIISETMPFVIIISIAFLFKNLISNNELISMRNVGFSIIDIYKPIAFSIFLFGLITLLIINPMSAKLERQFDFLTSKDFSDKYSIKFKNEGMWIKNVSDNNSKNYINIGKINLENMEAKEIKILNTYTDKNKLIIAKKGIIEDKLFRLINVKIYNINNNEYLTKNTFNLNLNFDKQNIVDSMSNFKHIPFFQYNRHIKNLKKFNLHSPEVSLYYLSEILKPLFLIVLGFTVMGFTGKFKKNENFFKVLFISILIGFCIFLLKEIVIAFTISLKLSFIFSYFIIFMLPLIVGLYQTIKIEND